MTAQIKAKITKTGLAYIEALEPFAAMPHTTNPASPGQVVRLAMFGLMYNLVPILDWPRCPKVVTEWWLTEVLGAWLLYQPELMAAYKENGRLTDAERAAVRDIIPDILAAVRALADALRGIEVIGSKLPAEALS
jgi:hypothetical protein